MDSDIAKGVKKSNDRYTSTGSPKLPENVTLAKIHEWQRNSRRLVKKLPGYIDGMLTQRPNFEGMSRHKKEYMKTFISTFMDG